MSTETSLVVLEGQYYPTAQADDDGHPRRFSILRRLGCGGQGAVYLACADDGEQVVIKEPHLPLGPDSGAATRFARELRNLSKCRHPNLIELRGSLVSGGKCYGVLEPFDGCELGQWLEQHDPLAEGPALEIAIEIARGLAAMHGAGIVHRDISARNVLIEGRPGATRIKIIDFGLAKSGAARDDISATGETGFTPRYCAPERIEPGSRQPDRSVDLYSLGVLLYRMLTGRFPFPQTTHAALMWALVQYRRGKSRPPAPRDLLRTLSPQTSRVTLDAMAATPEGRPASAEHLVAALLDCRLRLLEGQLSP